jgi:hypothetical protein
MWFRRKQKKEIRPMTDQQDVVIPSLPGFHQIRVMPPLHGKVSLQSIKEQARVFPVIAWKISADDARMPITPADDTIVDGELRALMLPGGVIVDADGAQHKGVDAWGTAVSLAWRAKQPAARGPAFALGPIATPAPQPAPAKSGWVG